MLGEHFSAGRLDADEYGQRTAVARDLWVFLIPIALSCGLGAWWGKGWNK